MAPGPADTKSAPRRHRMTVCPIAIAVGCRKCPIFAVCPVKSVIGDYKKEPAGKEPDATPQRAAAQPQSAAKHAPARAKRAAKRNVKKRR